MGMTDTNSGTHHECQILTFPIPALTGKAADKERIANLFREDYIDVPKMLLLLRQGGHGLSDEEVAETIRRLRQADAEDEKL